MLRSFVNVLPVVIGRVPVNKAFFEPHDQPEPEVKVIIPMFQPQRVTKCEKYRRIIAEPKVFIRIIEGKVITISKVF